MAMTDDEVRRLIYQILFGLSVGIAACALVVCLLRLVQSKTHRAHTLGGPIEHSALPIQLQPPYPLPATYPLSATYPQRTDVIHLPQYCPQSEWYTSRLPALPDSGLEVGSDPSSAPRRSKVKGMGRNAFDSLRKAPRAFLKSFYPPPDHYWEHHDPAQLTHDSVQGIVLPNGLWTVSAVTGVNGPTSAHVAHNGNADANALVQTHLAADPGDRLQQAEERERQRRERRNRRSIPRRAVSVLGDGALPEAQRRAGESLDVDAMPTSQPDESTGASQTETVTTSSLASASVSSPGESAAAAARTQHLARSRSTTLPRYTTHPSLPRYSAEFGQLDHGSVGGCPPPCGPTRRTASHHRHRHQDVALSISESPDSSSAILSGGGDEIRAVVDENGPPSLPTGAITQGDRTERRLDSSCSGRGALGSAATPPPRPARRVPSL